MIRGSRARALRKMERQEAEELGPSFGWLDKGIPDAVHDALEPVADRLDAHFYDYLGRLLGGYRLDCQPRPSPAEEIKNIRETRELIEQVLLRLSHLPGETRAFINELAHSMQLESFPDLVDRLHDDLGMASAMLGHTESAIEPYKGRAGATGKAPRDNLLANIAHQIENRGIGKEKSAGIAAAVLRGADIDAPEDPRKARAIIRKVEGPKNTS